MIADCAWQPVPTGLYYGPASQIQGFFDGPVDHLFAFPILADYIRGRVDVDNVTVVSPDTGRVRVAEQWAERLGGAPLAFVHKSRDLSQPNKAESKTVVGEVEGRVCVLIDMIDTGGQLPAVNQKAGGRSHCRPPASSQTRQQNACELWFGSRQHPATQKKAFRQPHCAVSCPNLGQCHSRGIRRRSVTSLFDGNA